MAVSSEGLIKIPNPVRRTAVVWWVLCFLLLSGIFVPFLLDACGIETGDWVFALMFFCLVFGITAVIIAVIYTRRARLVARMLNREGLLAHWSYSPAEWSRYADKEHRENKREKMNLAILIAAISIVVGAILTIIHPDGWLIFLVTVSGIIVLMAAVAALAVWLRYRQNLKTVGETYLSRDAVYLNRELHVWKGFGAKLEDVDYYGKAGAQGILKIVYSTPNRTGRVYVTVRVPVPAGEESTAKDIVGQIETRS